MAKRNRRGHAGRAVHGTQSPALTRSGAGARSPRRQWAAAAAVAAGTVCAAIIPVAVFHHLAPHPAAAAADGGWPAIARPVVAYPIRLPAGYQLPTGLAPDAGGGVWFFAQGTVGSAPRERLFHWSAASRSLAAYPVNVSDPALDAGLDTPIVAGPAGRAWLGINHSLLVARPGSAHLTVLPMPAVTLGAPGSGLPSLPVIPGGPKPGAVTPIESLTLGPGGRIIVGRAFATELQVVNPATFAVSDIRLPAGTALAGLGANDLASDAAGGMVAAVLYSRSGVHELGQYVRGAWHLAAGPCPAYAATVSGPALVVSGPGCVAAGRIGPGSPAGSATARPAVLSMVRTTGLPSQASPMAIALTRSAVLIDLRAGVVSASGGAESGPVSLGETVPGPSIGGSGSVSTARVPVSMTLVAPAAGGGAWFIPDAGAARIGLVTP